MKFTILRHQHGGSLKWWYPQIIYFEWFFPWKKPTILGSPIDGKPPTWGWIWPSSYRHALLLQVWEVGWSTNRLDGARLKFHHLPGPRGCLKIRYLVIWGLIIGLFSIKLPFHGYSVAVNSRLFGYIPGTPVPTRNIHGDFRSELGSSSNNSQVYGRFVELVNRG